MREDLKRRLLDFRNDRGWEKYHTGPNLAHALMVEAGELGDLFLWGTEPSLCDERCNSVREEIADIQIYLFYLAHRYGIDIDNAVENKIVQNEKKYPIGSGKISKHGGPTR